MNAKSMKYIPMRYVIHTSFFCSVVLITNAFSCCNIPKGVSSALENIKNDDERSDSNFNDVLEELDSI